MKFCVHRLQASHHDVLHCLFCSGSMLKGLALGLGLETQGLNYITGYWLTVSEIFSVIIML